nr:hypothetical protein [Propionicimonas sp.]
MMRNPNDDGVGVPGARRNPAADVGPARDPGPRLGPTEGPYLGESAPEEEGARFGPGSGRLPNTPLRTTAATARPLEHSVDG